jgi:hypothetical protein
MLTAKQERSRYVGDREAEAEAEAGKGREEAEEMMPNVVGLISGVFFAFGWSVAVASWLFAAYHSLKGFCLPSELPHSHRRKAVRAVALFFAGSTFAAINWFVGMGFGT